MLLALPVYRRSTSYRVLLLLALCMVDGVSTWGSRTMARLVENGYEDVVVAIHESTPEDPRLIARIRKIFTDASEALYRASRRRAYFKNITILIPTTWSDSAEYKNVRRETFENADIRVDPRGNPNVPPHNPYVMGSGRCEQGSYMHLTPRYLSDETFATAYWGHYDKTIIHEWAHLRWGVKDEYPTKSEDRFYVAANGNIEATRCSHSATGSYGVRDRRTHRYRSCRIDPRTGVYEKGCRFVSDSATSKNTASLMFRHFLPTVTEFCDNDPRNYLGYHNREAPNNQNRLCKGRSAWEVILDHSDFKSGFNLPSYVQSTVPYFKLVKEKPKRIAIIMDMSGSMMGRRLSQLRLALTDYITNVIEDGDMLGMASFGYNAFLLAPLTEVVDTKARLDLIQKLPDKAEGGTSIGAGLLAGLYVLSKSYTEDPSGGTIVLISDGNENVKPYINTVMGNITQSGVTVETIAFSRQADPQLANLAQRTGGLAYFASGLSTSSLDAPLTSIGNRNRRSPLVTVKTEAFILGQNESYTTNFTVDSTANAKTNTHITWEISSIAVKVRLTSPSGVSLDSSSDVFDYDCIDNKTVHFKMKYTEVGTWTILIDNKGGVEQRMSIITKAASKAGSDAISVTTQLPVNEFSFVNHTSIEISAVVRKGYIPIIRANVTALIQHEWGENVVITLRDSGTGADGLKDDGIYTAYFSNFSPGNGRYSVDVIVNNWNKKAEYNYQGTGLGAPPIDVDLEIFINNRTNEVIPDIFERRQTSGSFTLRDFFVKESETDDMIDVIPPSAITDMKITYVSYSNRTVTLQFTAPGNDFDIGTAHMFDLRFGYNFSQMYDNFTSCKKVLQTDPLTLKITKGSVYILEGDLQRPPPAGGIVTMKLKMPIDGANIYMFRMRAQDETGNYGEESNIVSANLQFIPPILEQSVSYLGDNETTNPIENPLEKHLVNVGLIIGLVVEGVIIATLVIVLALYLAKKYRTAYRKGSPTHLLSEEMHTFSV